MVDQYGYSPVGWGRIVTLVYAGGLVLSAFLIALAALTISRALESSRPRPSRSIFQDQANSAVFLFDGETLVDQSPAARALLSTLPHSGTPWARLMQHLGTTFPGCEAALADLADRGIVTLIAEPEVGLPLLLTAEWLGGMTRITLSEAGAEAGPGPDPFSYQALLQEVDALREVAAQMPCLSWRETASGDIVWSNAAYLLLAIDTLAPGQELSWPLPRLFDRVAASQGAAWQRARLTLPDKRSLWFDLQPPQEEEDERLFFATPADATVQAETALREFMQTLTKTFAQLPIGLAIFDHNRVLQLFNPALLDLTGLPPDFLMQRPSLLAVLDALRERRILPEPKDYHSWRQELVNMEKAASEGLYEETWNLPDGQVFQVTGRPHPNGALAMMIKDVSTETMRTRRYRADLELGQSVIDAMEEAVAVFSREGQLVMTNAAYAALWGGDPVAGMGTVAMAQMADLWRDQSAPGARWSEVEDYASTIGNRIPWAAEARLRDGRLLHYRCAPLAAGATLVAFRATAGEVAVAGEERRRRQG